ncbi:MFS transporter [Kocuria sp.]|uniref:MFS transporter n=1 Tax=Kocuria sp. TaxID=1871328 RepID=UPI0026DF991D|nr:MFS transporter [Kocuria sp.]MDO5619685.1 MFS transporter [Kocuria sp.]
MSITTPSPGFPAGSPEYRRILGTLSLGGLANFALIYFVQPLLPQFARSFDVPEGDTGAALSATTLAMIVGLLLAGPLADALGRIWVMSGSLVLSGLLTVACTFAAQWEIFLLLRALSGLALAGLPAIALAYLREQVDSAAHPAANAVYIAGTAMGGALGRLVPQPLSELGGWQVSAWVLGGFSVLIGAVVVLALPVDRPLGVRQSAHDVLVGPFTVLRNGQVALICVLGGVIMAVFVGAYNAIALRLEAEPFNLGNEAAVVYLAYPIGILAPGIFRRLADRWGRVFTVVLGLLAMGAAVAVTSPDLLPAALVGLGLLTFAFMGTHSMLSGWVVDRAHRLQISTAKASSAYLIFYYAGSTVSGTLSTHLWSGFGWVSVILWSAALVVVGLLCAVTLHLLQLRRDHG